VLIKATTVSNCTEIGIFILLQATLKAEINGKEISTMVSTSDLSITCGSTLHQLTARALINDWEEGLLAPDHLHHQVSRWG
jgi:poly [ADP-ribose] polymerase